MKAIKSFLPIITTLLLAIANIIACYYSKSVDVIYICLAIGLIIFMIILYLVKRTYDTKQKLPYPKWFWAFFGGRLSTQKEEKFINKSETLLLVGAEEKRVTDHIESIIDEFSPTENIKIDKFICPTKLNNKETKDYKGRLKKDLNGAGAIIFYRTRNLEKNDWIYEELDDWAIRHSYYPILRVDLLTENEKKESNSTIPEIFRRIPKNADPKLIPWYIHARSSQRANDWRSQASKNRYLGLVMMLITSIVFCCLIFGNKLSNHDYNYATHALNNLSDELLESYLGSLEINKLDQSKYAFSLWIVSNPNIIGNKSVYEVGWTNEGHPKPYNWQYNNSSIIGCTINENFRNHFVLWDKHLNDGDTVLWSSKNKATELIGNWNKSSKTIEIKKDGKELDECNFKDTPTDYESVLCYSYYDKDQDVDNICGICIASRIENDSIIRSKKSQKQILNLAKKFNTDYFPSYLKMSPQNIKNFIKNYK